MENYGSEEHSQADDGSAEQSVVEIYAAELREATMKVLVAVERGDLAPEEATALLDRLDTAWQRDDEPG